MYVCVCAGLLCGSGEQEGGAHLRSEGSGPHFWDGSDERLECQRHPGTAASLSLASHSHWLPGCMCSLTHFLPLFPSLSFPPSLSIPLPLSLSLFPSLSFPLSLSLSPSLSFPLLLSTEMGVRPSRSIPGEESWHDHLSLGRSHGSPHALCPPQPRPSMSVHTRNQIQCMMY